MSPSPPTLRRESTVVAALTLVGAVLRFWGAGRLGLNHFDEGIYALSGRWVFSPHGLRDLAPEFVSYSPPMFPILVGLSYLFLGMSDISAILVSQVAGILTIPAVAWVARRTFGPGAGAAAAALAALSGPHVAFSRMALTDSTFLLAWLVAIGFGQRFLERPGVLRALPFGVAVGLAQNAKYNGFLAGVIVAIAAGWDLVHRPASDRAIAARSIGYGVVAAIVASLVYLPWYRFVETQPGGYAALARHHRGYLSGISAWPAHWRSQMGQSIGLSGSLVEGLNWGVAAWPLAWIAGGFATWEPAKAGTRRAGMRFRLGLVAGTAVLGIAPNAGWWIALATLPWLLVDRRAAVRVVAVGWLVMAVLTPFYHPYARLWLPLHSLGWIVLSELVCGPDTSAEGGLSSLSRIRSTTIRPVALAAGVFAAVLVDAVFVPRARSLGSPIGPTDSYRVAAGQLASAINRRPPASGLNSATIRVLILARPVALFYLAPQIRMPIRKFPDLDSLVQAVNGDDVIVLDLALLNSQPKSSPNAFDFMTRRNIGRGASSYHLETPGATWADIDPAAVFDPRKDSNVSLRIYH